MLHNDKLSAYFVRAEQSAAVLDILSRSVSCCPDDFAVVLALYDHYVHMVVAG